MKPPNEVAELFKESCYDCHSHESKYPWYSSIAPFSWIVKHDIEEGREHLNFSLWATYDQKKANHKLEECYEEIEEGEMPLSGYTMMHGNAKLSKNEVEKITQWIKGVTDIEEH